MAEIKIEKKKPVWPWILLAIIILAVIAYFVLADEETDDYTDDVNTQEMGTGNNVRDDETENNIGYENGAASTKGTIAYTEAMSDSTRIATDSLYTKTALYNLSRAVAAKASQNGVNSEELKELIIYNSKMPNASRVNETESGMMSEDFKNLSDNIVIVLDSIQNKNYPSLETELNDLKETSADITTTAAVGDQKNTLRAYFRKANNVLNKMNI